MSALSLSLFGKLPARPDFVRVRCHGPASQELDQFLVRGVEQLVVGKVALASAPVRYIYCVPAAQSVLVGVLRESRDQVGRQFPLTLFCSLPLAGVGARLGALALAYRSFFAAAEQALLELQATPFEQLEARLDAIDLPEPRALPDAESALQRTFAALPSLAFVERAFGPASEAMHCYGFLTFLTAAKPARGTPPAQNATLLDCPVGEELDRLSWMELAVRVLRWRDAVPTCFWTEGTEAARCLLALGAAPPELLRALADPKHTSPRLWPLKTQRPEAVERARAALPGLLELEGVTTDRLLTLVAENAEKS